MARFRNIVFCLFFLGIGLAGCASSLLRGAPTTAEEAYKTAMVDLDDGLYTEAISGFTELKTKYPYSKYAALADLRIADTHFARGKYLEAIDAYRSFLKYHPSHEKIAYAMYRIGESYFEQIPDDWWFLPPAAEKDQAGTRLAISAFRDMLARFKDLSSTEQGRKQLEDCQKKLEAVEAGTTRRPAGFAECQRILERQDLVEQAQEKLEAARRKLADHEIYVAHFYFNRARYRAAAGRARGLLEDYSGLGLDKEALWLASRSYLELGELDRAEQALTRLLQEHPETKEAAEAADILNTMGSTADVESSRPSEGS